MRPAGAPLVSVVLPFRDAAATLVEALDSIREQTLQNFECILVDHVPSGTAADASSRRDASAAIAADYATRDHRFRVIRSGGSFVAALNCGVRAASAPLIARMDADDISHRSRLERQVEALHVDADLDLVSCLVECFPRAALAGGMRRYESWLNSVVSVDEIRAALFVESPLPHPSVVFRREVFDRVGGYVETDGPEDYDLWLRMILGGCRARKVPSPLLRWRDSATRLSRADGRYAKDRFFAAKLRHFPSAVAYSTPLQLWGTGPTARCWARRLREAGYEIRRFVDIIDKRVGRTVQGLTVEPPSAIRRADGLVLAAVGVPGARALIESHLQERGFLPNRDYLAVA